MNNTKQERGLINMIDNFLLMKYVAGTVHNR